MPYFLYEIAPPRSLTRIDSFERYRDAREAVRERRNALPTDAPRTVRMIFAPNEAEAERLLLEKREPRPLGEDA